MAKSDINCIPFHMRSDGGFHQAKIALEIMAKGDMNLSDKERSAQQELILKEICSVVVEKAPRPTLQGYLAHKKQPTSLGPP